jgi:cell division protein FtsI/penicillin-binding protein 2
MGIGQGPIAWTPLHAADAYATLARGGVRVRPTVVKRSAARADPPAAPVPSWAVDKAMEGLRLAVSDERGTGHHLTFEDGGRVPIFDVPGVSVWGKTGTASARRAVSEADGEGSGAGVADMDHSWFVVLVGRVGDRPRYAVAVLMEYAGSGGKVSGPIVNQVIRALAAEGYL